MTLQEIGKILALCASYDRRTVGEADVIAWFRAVGDLAFSDSEAAVVAHYQESREWIMPYDIRRRVTEVRKERLRAAGPVDIPEALADRPAEAVAWKQRVLEDIASGTEPRLAIEGAR